jgi:hypothetical protein
MFQAGKVKIKLKKKGPNKRGIPMIAFFGPDTSGATPISCGGDEELLSLPGSAYFSKCIK